MVVLPEKCSVEQLRCVKFYDKTRGADFFIWTIFKNPADI